MFTALGRACYRHRRLVVLGWLLAIVGGYLLGGQVFGRLGVDYSGSSVESFAGIDRLSQSSTYGDRLTVLVDEAAVTDPPVRAAVLEAAREVAQTPGVGQVVTAYTAPPPVAAGLVAGDGRASLVLVDLERDLSEPAADAALEAVTERFDEAAAQAGGQALVGGSPVVIREFNEQSEADLRRGELLSLPLVLVVMVVVFAGFVAASVPLIGAFASIAGGLTALYAASHVLQLDPSVPSVTTVLGLGLSVDYALLLVSRYREERALGRDPEDAVAATMATAGRTIAFSALTVAVSLSALFLFRIDVFRGLAVAGASAVVFALLSALTLVPALLALFRRRISAPTRPVPDEGLFARLARATQRRAWLVLLAVGGLLVLAGTPFLHARFQNGSVDLLPAGFESRQLAETVAQRFPGRSAEPVQVVAQGPAAELAAWADGVREDPRYADLVAAVGPVQERSAGYALVELVPYGPSQGALARELVEQVRADRPDLPTWVTGDAAVLVDFADLILAALPWAVLWVGVATVVLLFLMTGSVLVPLKALLMNTLSLGATFGALVWVFQDGNGADLLGFTPVYGLETWVPVITFAFAFGLSMDYEVFLLARVKELYDRGLDNDHAVALGLQRSGRIITSAALVMVIVCLGFASGEILGIKQLGLAMAIAVAVDATLVRTLLVPATMTLLGERNWWAPRPLRRLHERIGLREHVDLPAPQPLPPVGHPAGRP